MLYNVRTMQYLYRYRTSAKIGNLKHLILILKYQLTIEYEVVCAVILYLKENYPYSEYCKMRILYIFKITKHAWKNSYVWFGRSRIVCSWHYVIEIVTSIKSLMTLGLINWMIISRWVQWISDTIVSSFPDKIARRLTRTQFNFWVMDVER